MNLYVVYGEPTDGTYMDDYVQAVIAAAPSEQAARHLGENRGLLGDLDKYRVQKIGTADATEAKVIDFFYNRDY